MSKICRKRKEKKGKLASCNKTKLVMGKGYRIAYMNGKRLAASCSIDKGLRASKQYELWLPLWPNTNGGYPKWVLPFRLVYGLEIEIDID